MKKVFIDGGAFNGASIRKFIKDYPDYAEYEIHSFEPNNHNFSMLEQWLKKQDLPNVQIYNTALWIKEENKKLWGGDAPGSASATLNIFKGIRHQKHQEAVNPRSILPTVKCISLANWITTNYERDDYIVLKLDIEGAEYEIFDDFFSKNTFYYINEIVGEFHNKKCGIPIERDEQIVSKLKNEYGLNWKEWEAIEFYKE